MRVYFSLLGVAMWCACCAEADIENGTQVAFDPRASPDLVAGREVARSFEVSVKYQVGKLGVDLDATDVMRGLLVKSVLPDGALAEWNRTNPDQVVRPYDKIFSVNGKAGKVDELESRIVSSGERLVLGVRRPERYEIVIARPGSLGVRLHYKRSSKGVVISE
ncbi:unnamed protein product, partial [Effrenium voratum]